MTNLKKTPAGLITEEDIKKFSASARAQIEKQLAENPPPENKSASEKLTDANILKDLLKAFQKQKETITSLTDNISELKESVLNINKNNSVSDNILNKSIDIQTKMLREMQKISKQIEKSMRNGGGSGVNNGGSRGGNKGGGNRGGGNSNSNVSPGTSIIVSPTRNLSTQEGNRDSGGQSISDLLVEGYAAKKAGGSVLSKITGLLGGGAGSAAGRFAGAKLPIIGGVVDGVSEYAKDGNATKAVASGAATAGLGFMGSEVGMYGGAMLGGLVAGPIGAAIGAPLGALGLGVASGLAGGNIARSFFSEDNTRAADIQKIQRESVVRNRMQQDIINLTKEPNGSEQEGNLSRNDLSESPNNRIYPYKKLNEKSSSVTLLQKEANERNRTMKGIITSNRGGKKEEDSSIDMNPSVNGSGGSSNGAGDISKNIDENNVGENNKSDKSDNRKSAETQTPSARPDASPESKSETVAPQNGGVREKITAPRGNKSGNLFNNQQEAYSAARQSGLDEKSAKILVANMTGESLRNPKDKHWDEKHNSQGIVQWDDERSKRIKEHFGKEPREMSVTDQTKAAIWEMKNYYKPAYSDLTNPKLSDKDRLGGIIKKYEVSKFPEKDTEERFKILGGLKVKDQPDQPQKSIQSDATTKQTTPSTPKDPVTNTKNDEKFPKWMSERSKRELAGVNKPLAQSFLAAAEKTGYTFKVAEGMRSQEEANKNALTGRGVRNSQHLYGAAADLHIFDKDGKRIYDKERLYPFSEAVKNDSRAKGGNARWLGDLSGRWGKDIVHFDQGLGYGQSHKRDPYVPGYQPPTKEDIAAQRNEILSSKENPFRVIKRPAPSSPAPVVATPVSAEPTRPAAEVTPPARTEPAASRSRGNDDTNNTGRDQSASKDRGRGHSEQTSTLESVNAHWADTYTKMKKAVGHRDHTALPGDTALA